MADHPVKHALGAAAIGVVGGVLLYPLLIGALARAGTRQRVQDYNPLSHRVKQGTPTMGGLLFVALALVAWLVLDRSRAGFVLFFALGAGALLGFIDDLANVRGRVGLGLGVREKLAFQGLIGLLVGAGLDILGATRQLVPGLGAPDLHGAGIVLASVLAVVAVTNAVNLTDGVDGLAASCCAVVFAGLAAIAVSHRALPAAVAAAAAVGVLLAFLLFNWHPARVFMGDTGSLALGGLLVAVAAELHLLWFLPLLGVVFLAETLSVIVNVTAIRRYGRRILRASPLHHHFEELGVGEQRLVIWFAAVAAAGTLLTVLYARAASVIP